MHTANCVSEPFEGPHAHKRRLSGANLANKENLH
jgi:hypothetical protein